MEQHAILSTVSETLVEIMNGQIGISHPQITGLKRWLHCLAIQMSLSMIGNLSEKTLNISGTSAKIYTVDVGRSDEFYSTCVCVYPGRMYVCFLPFSH